MRNAVCVLVVSICLSACSGPMGPIPGGALEGEAKAWPEDWTFSNEVENVLLQTNPNDPYSVTVWCVASNGTLYFAAEEQDSTWALNIAESAQVVVSIEGKLYQGNATSVTSKDEAMSVIEEYLVKYEIESIENFVQEGGVLFRLSKP